MDTFVYIVCCIAAIPFIVLYILITLALFFLGRLLLFLEGFIDWLLDTNLDLVEEDKWRT